MGSWNNIFHKVATFKSCSDIVIVSNFIVINFFLINITTCIITCIILYHTVLIMAVKRRKPIKSDAFMIFNKSALYSNIIKDLV